MSVSICGGTVAENKRGVAFARAFFHDAAHVGQKTHVEHAVGFVEHEKFHLVQLQRALFQMIEQSSGRGDDDVRAGAQFIVLLAVADAAEDDGDFQIGEAGEIAEGGFHLRGEFARGFEDEHARAAGLCWPSLERMGKANAAVLPVPVCALPMTSCRTERAEWRGAGWAWDRCNPSP